MKLTTSKISRLEELNEMAQQVDQFDIDWGSTMIDTLWDLRITYSNKFVWFKAEGCDPLNERITLSSDMSEDDFRYYTRELRKALKQAIR